MEDKRVDLGSLIIIYYLRCDPSSLLTKWKTQTICQAQKNFVIIHIKSLGEAVIYNWYPKVHGAEGREYDRVHVVPLEVDNEKYPVDLDGQAAQLWEKA